MVNIVGVRFKKAGKIYYFDPGELLIEVGTNVIVETARGIEFGTVVIKNREVPEDSIIAPLKAVIRISDEKDTKTHNENIAKEKNAFNICQQKITDHKLQMKLIDVEYTFDNNKVLFYFTADGRIDFRELVKDLGAVFKTRIELRQIGVRDEAKMIGGVGICGRPLCCGTFLSEFQPVSIKMAKEQSLSINPAKISGSCGRLMCCLKYENDVYEEKYKRMPRVGAIVSTPDGQGVIMEVNILKELIKVKLDKETGADLVCYNVNDEIKIMKDVEVHEDDAILKELKHLED